MIRTGGSGAGRTPVGEERTALEMQRHFEILGIRLTLIAPAQLLEPIAFAYGRFEKAPPSGSDPEPLVVRWSPTDGLTVGATEIPALAGVEPGIQFYNRLQIALMDAIDSHMVLHAAALTDSRGGAFLLAGPSGHGKSSMALELARRGRRLMSDDIAPLRPAEGLVEPFPRAVAVIPHAGSPLPEPFATRSRESSVRWFGKVLLDVGAVLGEAAVADRAAPLRTVLILAAADDADGTSSVVELVAPPADTPELSRRFERTEGVVVERRESAGPLERWTVRLDHTRNPTRELRDVFESERVLVFEKRWDRTPDFDAEPSASPIPRHEAAVLLAREMLNRRSAGRLSARYGGSAARLFVELAGALGGVACWKVRVGSYTRTADLIEGLLADADRDRPAESSP